MNLKKDTGTRTEDINDDDADGRDGDVSCSFEGKNKPQTLPSK